MNDSKMITAQEIAERCARGELEYQLTHETRTFRIYVVITGENDERTTIRVHKARDIIMAAA